MDKITFTLNDQPIITEAGKTILAAALEADIHIPHYCYHPGLSISGNCRMCLVEIQGIPKLQTSCSTAVREGMVVSSRNERVQTAVRHVLEYLLINHPVDCPVCDQAGECGLQDYYMRVGRHDSRFAEDKVTKPKKATPIGQWVILDQERCILCSRCVRFTREITGTNEMAIFNRGDSAEIDVYPGRALRNRYSANIMDICPVGALTCRDFRFQCRVWYLKTTPSICPGCARGCNITIHHSPQRPHKGNGRRVFRLKPRPNPDVNRFWLCDDGRYGYRPIDTGRLRYCIRREESVVHQLHYREAIDQLAGMIREAPAGKGIYLLSAQSTNEELFATRALFRDWLGFDCLLPDAGIRTGDRDDFLIHEDKNPNTRGVEEIFGISAEDRFDLKALPALAAERSARLVLVNRHELDADTCAGLARAGCRVVFLGTNESETPRAANLCLPVAVYAEKEGTFTNCQGRVQKIFLAVPPAGEAEPEWMLCHRLAARLEAGLSFGPPSAIFSSLSATVNFFRGLDYQTLGLLGKAGAHE